MSKIQKLYKWSLRPTPGQSLWRAPETVSFSLQGKRLKDLGTDRRITTSPIIGQCDGLIHTASGSRYELVNVDPEYEKLYPYAKERIFKSINKIENDKT